MRTVCKSLLALLAMFALLFGSPAISAADTAARMQTFDIVWRRVRDQHFDAKLNGVNWNAVRRKYAPRVKAVKSDAQFYQLLNTMLGELKQSHFGVIPPDAFLASDSSQGSHEGETGMTVQLVEGRAMVTQVEEKSSAQEQGIRPGFVIVAAKGKPAASLLAKVKARKLKPVEERMQVRFGLAPLFSGPIGSKVKINYLDEADKPQEAELECRRPQGEIVRFGYLPPTPSRAEWKRLPDNIGYLRFNIFLLPLIEPIRRAMRELHDTDGMIIDLRGNLGGIGFMATSVTGLFSAKQGTLGTMKLRQGKMDFVYYPAANPYKKPLIILTDEASISTSEILAGSLQELGMARTAGSASPGMVLPSNIERLPGGARMQYVIADFKTPKGRLLEGRGVLPDIPVTLTREKLLKGDPILEAALAALRQTNSNTPTKTEIQGDK